MKKILIGNTSIRLECFELIEVLHLETIHEVKLSELSDELVIVSGEKDALFDVLYDLTLLNEITTY